MISATVAALACLCLARASPAEQHNLRAYAHNTHITKEMTTLLATIEERLRVLDTISIVQAKQTRKLEVMQDKLDRVETTLSLRLERAQLAVERLEHRLHVLQTSVQTSIKESDEKITQSQTSIEEVAKNLTLHLQNHKKMFEKVIDAYEDTGRRGFILEPLVKDGLSLINVTRRELADGLRLVARRQGGARLTWQADLDTNLARRLNENTQKIVSKMEEVLDTQKQFVDSCQRVQLDDPTHVAGLLDKLIDSLINKTASTFRELQNIQVTMRNHDNKVMKMLNSGKTPQTDVTCSRLESAFKNSTVRAFTEKELQQLTEKFISLTDRADAALQRLEMRMTDYGDEHVEPSEVTAEADRLLQKLGGIKSEDESAEGNYGEEDVDDDGYFDDSNESDLDDEKDSEVIRDNELANSAPTRPPHRRHPHKHPYDRGPY